MMREKVKATGPAVTARLPKRVANLERAWDMAHAEDIARESK